MLNNIDEEFFKAIKNNNTTEIQLLLNSTEGVRLIHLTNQNHRTALHYAAELGLINTVGLLLNFGTPKEYVDYEGKTPLILAIINDHREVVRLLIDHNVDINGIHIKEKYHVPFYYAVSYRRDDIVCELINRGVELKVCSFDMGQPESRLIWLEKTHGQVGIHKTLYNIIKTGLLADSLYEGKISDVVMYLKENINIQDTFSRLLYLCKSNSSFGNFINKKDYFPEECECYLKWFINTFKSSSNDVIKVIEKPLALILNQLFPGAFPSIEPYSILTHQRRDTKPKYLSINLQSYIKTYSYQPYFFIKKCLLKRVWTKLFRCL